MKTSQFNTFFPYEDKIIGYNALADDFIIIDPFLFSLYEAAKAENKISDINDYHDEFYDFLLQKKFIINDDLDELMIVKSIREKVDLNDESYFLVVNPTMNCNFKCWYCYESHIKDSKMHADIVDRVIKFSDNIIDSGHYKEFHLSWFGGEPLLYFSEVIKPVLSSLYEKFNSANIKFSSSFTTNGLLINQQTVDFCKDYNGMHFQITLDGDEERHDLVRFISKSKGSYKQIIDNISTLSNSGCQVTVRINISENTIPGLQNIANDFQVFSSEQLKNIIFSFHKVWQVTTDLNNEIGVDIKYFRSLGYRVEYIGARTDTLRSSCYADKKNQATINYNGDVFKCTARDFKSDSKEGVLNLDGSISWNEKRDERLNVKFKNPPCLKCKILPICNGGCSQNALESKGEDYCVFDFDENKKDEVIYHKFLEKVIYA